MNWLSIIETKLNAIIKQRWRIEGHDELIHCTVHKTIDEYCCQLGTLPD